VRILESEGIPFLWAEALNPETYDTFRINGDSAQNQRKPDEIVIEEYTNAALYVLKSHISLPESELARETARLLGFQRMVPLLEQRVNAGIGGMLHRKLARLQDGKILLPRNT